MSSNEIRINVFGDFCLVGVDPNNYKLGDDVRALMSGAINVANLECPVTSAETKRSLRSVNFKVEPELLEVLDGFQAVSLANNHIADYLDQGIQDTIKHVDEKGLKWFGVGKTYTEALKPCIIECQGRKIAFFGATRWANPDSEHEWGTAVERIGKLKKLIRELKSSGCIVIPYFHWGYEYVRIPAPKERGIAKACIDAGADIVIGGHPHIFQGYEVYKGKYIYYSLGNTVFQSERFNNGMAMIIDDPRLFNSFLVSITIDENGILHPEPKFYQLSDTRVRMLTEEEAAAQKKELEKVSDILRLPYRKYWKRYYHQAVTSCKHHIYMRKNFQKIEERSFKDKLRIMLFFNSQDLRNRLAHLVPWLFE